MILTMRNEIATPTMTTLVANTDTPVDFDNSDERIVLVINASADTTLTVKAGNHIQGVADKTFEVKKGIHLLKLDSGRFMNVSGDNKNKIVVNSPGTPGIGVAAMV